MIHLQALGPPRLTLDGRDPPPELLWRKNLALLVYLARSRERSATREALGGLLWPERPEAAARHSLNEAVRVIRRHAGEDVLRSKGERLDLPEEALVLDTDLLDRHLAGEEWETAAALVNGRFLEGFGVADASAFEDWMAAERSLWLRQSILALVGWAERQATRGDLQGASRTAGRALVLDPLSDAAARATMRTAALAGDRGAALRVHAEFVDRLRADVGAEPETETRRLAERIRRERTWSLPEALRERRDGRRLELVGREDEMERLLEAWREGRRSERAAVLIVEGDPGSGRSRVAEELTARARLEGAIAAAIRAVPADASEPWSGLAGLLDGGLLEAPGLAAAPVGALAWAAELAPGWHERFREEIARVGEKGPWSPLRAFAELLRPPAEEQPLLLVVDDAVWLDPASASALDGTLRTLERLPVSLLVTVEPAPGAPDPSGAPGPADTPAGAGAPDGPTAASILERLRAHIGRDLTGTCVRLEPLDPATVRALAARALPEYGSEALDRVARRVHLDSAGLPLLAVELLSAVRLGLELDAWDPSATGPPSWPRPDRTLDQTMPAELPDPLVSAIRVSYRRLSAEAQRVLAAASVLDDRVDVGTLVRATGQERSEVEAALDELEWHRWLAAEARGYTFVARVVRRVVARDMTTAGQRARFRQRAAAHLRSTGDDHLILS